jgi:enoyl-CoA hydratase
VSRDFDFLDVGPVQDAVLTVELSRPPVNAFHQPFYRELADFFETVDADLSVGAVVLSGAGRMFCGGNDLHEFLSMSPENGDARMRTVHRALFAVYDSAVPVVAAVHGAALGTGFALAACSDLVVAAGDAKFGLPEINVGVLGGAKFGARMLPQQAVRRLFFTGEPVSAATMREWGAPFEIVDPDHVKTAARELAEGIARKSPRALRVAKQALNACEPMDLKTGYAYEQSFTVRMSGQPEAKQATQAVLESVSHKPPPSQGPTEAARNTESGMNG